ncbi:hypothetical protein GCM10010435_25900 [Winogradskya consettensis]|uniref:Uncharacterized protein n=1 Tax=Winogradskya consettensis TaxID=113560 RepID=A0A919SAH5_9ACTN|nr:EAL domain-containing protein [Actinoplanes consettensis]GIM67972.1 hypothetical protein Aco04nite_08690 [Actinoplanes consettensis]
MTAARLQLRFGAWIVALTAVFYLFPAISMYSWAAIGLSAAGAVLVGVRRHRPANPAPWYLLAAVLVSFTAGDTTYNILTDFLGRTDPFPSLGDVFYLLVYPMLAIALAAFIRYSGRSDDRGALLDALVPTAGLGLLSWILLISPYVRDDALGLLEKLTSIAYPLGDVLALAMVARLLTAGGRRPAPVRILAAGVACLLLTDVVYGLRQLDGSWVVGGPVDLGWVAFYAAIALAALHPSMAQLTEPDETAVYETPGGRRIVAMSVAVLIAPVALLIEFARGAVTDAPMIAVASATMFLLVMARVAGLLRHQRDTAARERTLRIAGAELVAVGSEAEVLTAVRTAMAHMAPRVEPYRLHFYGTPAAQDTPIGFIGTGRVAVAELPADVAVMMTGFPTALYAEAIAGSPDGTLRHNRAVFAASEQVLQTLSAPFAALMAQGTMAIERIVLTQQVHRRGNEDYFRALIQNASDVILIVDAEDAIRYASPSALAVFGRDDLAGTTVYELITSIDHAGLRHFLGEVRAGRGRDAVDLSAISAAGTLLQVECVCRDLRDEPAVSALVMTIRDVTERRQLQDDIAHQAFHDTLTGLANRALLQNRLAQMTPFTAATHGSVSVLFIDLDDFKEINDTLGHEIGDQVLITVGHRIAGVAGALNLAARTGGDEFAVLIEHDGGIAEAGRIASRIIAALGAPIEVSDGAGGVHLVSGAASVGVATAATHGDVSDLLRHADVAMYAAKAEGKNNWQPYRDELHDAAVRRLELRSALTEAVPGGQMRLRYQPIVDLSSGDTVGVEALVRWQHPVLGLLGPQEFIELCEQNGAIVAVGGWVLREALRTFASWSAASPDSPLRYVSVNVSARQFRTPGFVDQVRAVLAETGTPPGALLLEITESLVLHDAEQVWRDLRELRAWGVRIAIDDFGTGYSSLSYLSQMPVDVLKIDKSFIDDILHSRQQLALVETIISLAAILDLKVVAEGIELAEHRAALIEMGCPYGQGYLFAKPLTSEDLHTWLHTPAAAAISDAG